MDARKPLIRNSGRIDPATLLPETQRAIMALKTALAREDWIRAAQVTFDQVQAMDYPPTVDVKVEFRAHE